MSQLRLKHIKRLSGQILVVTGLHIGGARESIEIGGMDNPIIKDPVTHDPYIPGSSLKGKMRSILEIALGKIHPKGDPYESSDEKCPISRVFGSTNDEVQYGPTRIVVRDARLNRPETAKALKLDNELFPYTDIIEEKTENRINRIQGKAEHPRQQERVIPNTRFDFEILYKVYDVNGDDGATDEELFQHVRNALTMIELDYIGGNGTRGCGQIRFINQKEEIAWDTAGIAEGVAS